MQKKELFKYVFVILVYRNYADLIECVESIKKKVKSHKIIIVNAFYDDFSKNEIERIAEIYDCVFINEPNKGYSHGNNVGISYAKNNFEYDYIVISNPDVVINEFPDMFSEADIIAPNITVASGKQQNPMYLRYHALSDKLIYLGFKKKTKLYLLMGLGINKCFRLFDKITMTGKDTRSIYAAHGSFVMLSKHTVDVFNGKPYDEKMFLFAEEMVLAAKAKKENLITRYAPQIKVFHKEDGSMSLGDVSVNNELANGNIYYYENYIKRQDKMS